MNPDVPRSPLTRSTHPGGSEHRGPSLPSPRRHGPSPRLKERRRAAQWESSPLGCIEQKRRNARVNGGYGVCWRRSRQPRNHEYVAQWAQEQLWWEGFSYISVTSTPSSTFPSHFNLSNTPTHHHDEKKVKITHVFDERGRYFKPR